MFATECSERGTVTIAMAHSWHDEHVTMAFKIQRKRANCEPTECFVFKIAINTATVL